MYKPDDTLIIDCILQIHTAVLVSCLLHSCMHLACVFKYLFIYAFWTKIDRIYKHKFSGVSNETSPILDSCASTSNTLNRGGKILRQFVQKMVEKNDKKNDRCCKASCVNTQTQKFVKIFENVCILIMTPKIRRLTSLHHFSSDNLKNTS